MQHDHKIIIFSAPSGAGKTTIIQHIEKRSCNLVFSISATTKKKRDEEIHGKDYYFLSHTEFKECIRKNEFVEWEEVYTGQYYGTLKSEVERIWRERKTPIFDIDVIGALNVKEMYGGRVLTIFVAPPSPEVLEKRLIKRGTEDKMNLKRRIAKAKKELSYANKFDKILVNDILEKSFKQAEQLVSDFLKAN